MINNALASKQASKQASKRIPQLEGLRFIMCCIIILSHLEFLSESEVFGDFYKIYLHNPTLAVDYFFMLSGFGIYLSPKRPENSIKGGLEYAVEKVKKIYPAYIVSLILGMIWVYLITDGFVKTIAKLFIFGITDITLLQSIVGMTMFSHSINGVCWFLSALFICYIFSPYFLWIVDKLKTKKQALTIICVFVIITLTMSSFALLVENKLSFFDDLWYGHPIIRCWYLAIGMCIGYLHKESNIPIGSYKEFFIAITAVFYFVGRNSIPFDEGVLRFFDILFCTIFIYTFACGNGKVSKVFSSKNLVNLGKSSMYLFLFHYPVRMVIGTLFKNIGLKNEWLLLIQTILIISITYLITYSYGIIEYRLITFINRFKILFLLRKNHF